MYVITHDIPAFVAAYRLKVKPFKDLVSRTKFRMFLRYKKSEDKQKIRLLTCRPITLSSITKQSFTETPNFCNQLTQNVKLGLILVKLY